MRNSRYRSSTLPLFLMKYFGLAGSAADGHKIGLQIRYVLFDDQLALLDGCRVPHRKSYKLSHVVEVATRFACGVAGECLFIRHIHLSLTEELGFLSLQFL